MSEIFTSQTKICVQFSRHTTPAFPRLLGADSMLSQNEELTENQKKTVFWSKRGRNTYLLKVMDFKVKLLIIQYSVPFRFCFSSAIWLQPELQKTRIYLLYRLGLGNSVWLFCCCFWGKGIRLFSSTTTLLVCLCRSSANHKHECSRLSVLVRSIDDTIIKPYNDFAIQMIKWNLPNTGRRLLYLVRMKIAEQLKTWWKAKIVSLNHEQ